MYHGDSKYGKQLHSKGWRSGGKGLKFKLRSVEDGCQGLEALRRG